MTDRKSDTCDGRLQSFALVPPRDLQPNVAEADWTTLFRFAGINPALLRPSVPSTSAPADNDQKAAWSGADPRDGLPVRIETASLRGRPVWFRVVRSWDRGSRPFELPSGMLWTVIATVLWIVLPLGALFLARSNLRRGQGDPQGALRLAIFGVGTMSLALALRAHHVSDFVSESRMGSVIFGRTLVVRGVTGRPFDIVPSHGSRQRSQVDRGSFTRVRLRVQSQSCGSCFSCSASSCLSGFPRNCFEILRYSTE